MDCKVVGKRIGELEIGSFLWDYREGRNVQHIGRHGVLPSDVQEVKDNHPRFFDARKDKDGYVMLGPNSARRYMYAALIAAEKPGEVVCDHRFLDQQEPR